MISFGISDMCDLYEMIKFHQFSMVDDYDNVELYNFGEYFICWHHVSLCESFGETSNKYTFYICDDCVA